MVMRRSEIPSLNSKIVRQIEYNTSQDSFGSLSTTTLERVTRARLLGASPGDRLRISNPHFQDQQLRSYLVRPVHDSLTYTFTKAGVGGLPDTTEERTLSLDWDSARVPSEEFRDAAGILWRVQGVGFFDSAGRMLEILAAKATRQG